MENIKDNTNLPKAVKIGTIVYDATIKENLIVIDCYEKVAFNCKKNIARLNSGRTFINTEDGIKALGLELWTPEVGDYVILRKTLTKDGFETKKVKFYNKDLKQVVFSDGTQFLEFIEPFTGSIPLSLI